jgi:hypothetical protein
MKWIASHRLKFEDFVWKVFISATGSILFVPGYQFVVKRTGNLMAVEPGSRNLTENEKLRKHLQSLQVRNLLVRRNQLGTLEMINANSAIEPKESRRKFSRRAL